jgi:hypothetical protein
MFAIHLYETALTFPLDMSVCTTVWVKKFEEEAKEAAERTPGVYRLPVDLTRNLRTWLMHEPPQKYTTANTSPPKQNHQEANRLNLHTTAEHTVPLYTRSTILNNPLEEYNHQCSESGDPEGSAEEDLSHVLTQSTLGEALAFFKMRRPNFSMQSLLALLLQPVLDKFHEFQDFKEQFDYTPLMNFGFWYFAYHQIYGKPPQLIDEYSLEKLENFSRNPAAKDNPAAQELARLLRSQEITYEATCDSFEEHFKLMPPKPGLDYTADLYVSTIDRIDLSPAFASLLTNMAMYENVEKNGLCYWSQPPVNHRSTDIIRLGSICEALLYNEKNHKGLCHEEYTCFPYVITNGEGMPVESMIGAVSLLGNMRADSVHNHSQVAEDLYEFAFKMKFNDSLLGEEPPQDVLDSRPFQIVGYALQKMNQKYRGLGHIQSLMKLYRHLLNYLATARKIPREALNTQCLDYAQLFHSCRIAFQAAFPLRLGIIDGGHRIITALAAIYNVTPSLRLSDRKSFLRGDTLDLSRVCQNVQFKMAWPNGLFVEKKQTYDSMVSRLEFRSFFLFRISQVPAKSEMNFGFRTFLRNPKCIENIDIDSFSFSLPVLGRHLGCWRRTLRICRSKRVIQKTDRL